VVYCVMLGLEVSVSMPLLTCETEVVSLTPLLDGVV
jgi:hypothetical protein